VRVFAKSDCRKQANSGIDRRLTAYCLVIRLEPSADRFLYAVRLLAANMVPVSP